MYRVLLFSDCVCIDIHETRRLLVPFSKLYFNLQGAHLHLKLAKIWVTIFTNLRDSWRLGDHCGDKCLQEDERKHYCHRHVKFALRFQWEKHRRKPRDGHK